MDNNYNDLYEKFSRLQWLLHRHRLQTSADCGVFADTTRGQGRVMAMLKLQPEISTKDLSYLMGIRHQSLNELLNKLEKSEYISRSPSEQDRRVTIVRLTEKGKEAQQKKQDFSGIFDCLTGEEKIALNNYLGRIITALESQLGMQEDDEMQTWMDAARARMGDEAFERLLSLRDSHKFGHGPFGGRFFDKFGGGKDADVEHTHGAPFCPPCDEWNETPRGQNSEDDAQPTTDVFEPGIG